MLITNILPPPVALWIFNFFMLIYQCNFEAINYLK